MLSQPTPFFAQAQPQLNSPLLAGFGVALLGLRTPRDFWKRVHTDLPAKVITVLFLIETFWDRV